MTTEEMLFTIHEARDYIEENRSLIIKANTIVVCPKCYTCLAKVELCQCRECLQIMCQNCKGEHELFCT